MKLASKPFQWVKINLIVCNFQYLEQTLTLFLVPKSPCDPGSWRVHNFAFSKATDQSSLHIKAMCFNGSVHVLQMNYLVHWISVVVI